MFYPEILTFGKQFGFPNFLQGRNTKIEILDFLDTKRPTQKEGEEDPPCKKQRVNHAEYLQRTYAAEKEIVKRHGDPWDPVLSDCMDIGHDLDCHEGTMVMTAMAASEVLFLSGSTITDQDEEKYRPVIMKAKKAEIKNFFDHDAIEEVPKSSVTGNTVTMRWVLTWKDAETSVSGLPPLKRVKARLVARGFQDPAQKNGLLINTAKMALRGTNQVVMSVGALKGWALNKMDIATAFLKSDYVKRDIWLSPPVEAGVSNSYTWKAKKAIYGLSDAPSEFHRTLTGFFLGHEVWLQQLGVTISNTELDPCLFLAKEGEELVGIFSTHVDDILIAANPEFGDYFRAIMDKRFDRTKFEDLPFVHCGTRITKAADGFVLDQNDYCGRLVEVEIPSGVKDGDLVDEDTLYHSRAAIGRVTYLAYGTRPDLTARIGDISSRVTKLTFGDVRELNATAVFAKKQAKDYRYCLKSDLNLEKLHLCAFTDCAVGGVDGKSRAGVVIALTDGFPQGSYHVLTWGSKIIRRVMHSSLAGEVLAICEWANLVTLMRDAFGLIYDSPLAANILTDCESLFSHLRKGSGVQDRLLIRPFLQIQDLLQQRVISNIGLISGKDNPSDALTKGVGGVVGPLKSLMSVQSLPRIRQFEWLQIKHSARPR